MAAFILTILILFVCGLLFGKADTKKELLNQIGLDLSDSNYSRKKEQEFEKYCKNAMKAAIDQKNYKTKNESDFICYLIDQLNLSAYGKYEDDGLGEKKYTALNLGIKKHYVEHALEVAYRRKEDMKKGNNKPLVCCDFSDKYAIRKYIDILWNKYQYPWPEDWQKRDGM